MKHTASPYPVENGWIFGLKWSTVGVMTSLLMLGGCALFDIDENKERHNKVYGERKSPQLNPQVPRAAQQKEAGADASQIREARSNQATAPQELTPFDQFNSQESVNAAPPPVAPQFDAPTGPLATQDEVAAIPAELEPLPEVVEPTRALPKENQTILGAQTPSAPEQETFAPIVQSDAGRVSYEPPVVQGTSPLDTMPAKEIAPVAAAEIAPAYTPPLPESAYAAPIASGPDISPPAGTLGTITYNSAAAPVASAAPAQPAYAYQPYQPPLPLTVTAPAPTPVGPLVLNAPEEALQTERYLPQSRYTTRRNFNRRVNAY